MRLLIFRFLTVLPLLLTGACSLGYSQASEDVLSLFRKNESDSVENHGTGLVFIPYIYYTPDTRWGFGGLGIKYFRLGDEEETKHTRLSYVKMLADYTLNQQIDVWTSGNIFFPEEKYLLRGEARYRTYPDKYYGIGNHTPYWAREKYSYNSFYLNTMFMKQVKPKLFVGLNYQFADLFHMQTDSFRLNGTEGELYDGHIHGARGGINSGIGFIANYDLRESIFYSRTGMFAELSTYYFTPLLGSDFRYVNVNFNLTKYVPVQERSSVAFQLTGNFNSGDIPFYNLAKAGDKTILRGYAKNRYRDKHFIGTQAEYRFPIWKMFSGTVFTGVGDVFGKPEDLGLRNLKYTYGGGLRVCLDAKEKVNIRLDYGFGKDAFKEGGNRSFYLSIGEAF